MKPDEGAPARGASRAGRAGRAGANTPAGDLCLITGASGFIGGHLVECLVREGHRVRCLVRPTSDTARLERLDVELVDGDLTTASSLQPAAAGCRHVLHCGALVSDWATVEEIRRINVLGTQNLLQASIAASVERFIHFSTTDVYGYPGAKAVDETQAPGRFRNWYAQTKLEAEQEVRRASQTRALQPVILRPATVYGPRSEEVIGEMAAAMRRGQMLLVDRGRAVAGLTYVENVTDAAVLALRRDAAVGQAFNITDALPITWRQFVDDLADGLGCRRVRLSLPLGVAEGLAFSLEHTYRLLRRTARMKTPPLLSRQAVHVLGRQQDFSNQKAKALLGWEPRVDYTGGLAATLAWLREKGPATRAIA
jgi:nucleoside-diphosphate-sugar epimerase